MSTQLFRTISHHIYAFIAYRLAYIGESPRPKFRSINVFKYSVVVFLLSWFATNVSAEETRCFSKITGVISPFLEYNPRGEISCSESDQYSHYKVVYLANGRLSEMRYFRKAEASSRAYYEAHRVSYEYRADGYSRKYYDIEGKPTSMWRHYYGGGDIHEEHYKHTKIGTELSLFNSAGEAITTQHGHNQFVKKTINKNAFTQRQFDDKGSPVGLMGDFMPFTHSMITTDKRGYLYQVLNLDDSGEKALHPVAGYAEFRLDFDDFGNELGWSHRDEAGELINLPQSSTQAGHAKWVYKMTWYNRELGLIRSYTQQYYDEHGQRVWLNGEFASTYVFDQLGNLTSLEYLDDQNQLLLHPQHGHAIQRLHRNSNHRVHEILYLNTNGQLIENGVAQQRYVYGEDGSLKEIKHLTHTGEEVIQ
ncbi:hypothetical protein DRW07_10825 [Alteromonas sediminis]|uniref:Uncharacterized protein n=1 Tax=Alteromonas sediminis TaxID=2259342 RepID=A0A3N5Y0G6_9ALTE|nr:hypothetical protein [Alteromonas sediminis]RPJ66570.1 hypothetical protein DRW07_10825 [Alteromonas sediminis]